jgi:hypothetical protein
MIRVLIRLVSLAVMGMLAEFVWIEEPNRVETNPAPAKKESPINVE